MRGWHFMLTPHSVFWRYLWGSFGFITSPTITSAIYTASTRESSTIEKIRCKKKSPCRSRGTHRSLQVDWPVLILIGCYIPLQRPDDLTVPGSTIVVSYVTHLSGEIFRKSHVELDHIVIFLHSVPSKLLIALSV